MIMNSRMSIAMIILLLVAGNVIAQNAQPEQLVVPLSQPGKPYSLDVQLMYGSIKVTTGTGNDVIIKVTLKENMNKKETEEKTSDGLRRIPSHNGFGISAREEDNVIKVSNESFMKKVDLSLEIPQNVKLKLGTINNGDIEVENVKGQLEVNNVNGAIKLTNISGSAVVSTVNGGVKASFASVDASAAMAFSALQGKIDVTLPADTKANLKLKSGSGEVYTDFDVEVSKTEPKTEVSTEKNMHKISVDDWVYGKINGGGSQIMMKNTFGDIYLRKAK